MRTCAIEKCGQDAHHILKLMVPATGYSLLLHQPMGMLIDLPHCKACLDKVLVADFLDEGIKKLFRVMASGRVPPDFKRAFIKPVAIDSEEYAMFERMRAGRTQ